MKITYPQLEQQISKKLAPLYIVSGDELLLKQDAINLIRKAVRQVGFNERTRVIPEAGYNWEELHTLLYSSSMFAEKQLIELDFRESAPNKTASKILQDYAKNTPSPDRILLIETGKIDDKIAKSAWYQALEKIGPVVAIWPIPREQLPLWIVNRAKKYRMPMAMDAATLLADYVEGNLVAAAQAIEKMYLLRYEGTIDTKIVETILADESRYTIFDFTESLVSGDKPRSLHILNSLQLEGTEPVLILWGITRELRLLAAMAQQLKQGHTWEKLFQQHRIFSRRQSAVRKFLSRLSVQDCWHHLTCAAEIDGQIKGGASGNVWDSLQLFCLRL